MNATERLALRQGVEHYDEMTAAVDERTLAILDRRRRTAIVKRRGWLIRRALLAADIVGLALAFTTAEVLVGPGSGFGAAGEYGIFVAALPLWVIGAKLYGLYDHDEERTDHSTVDDLVGVFNLVTVGSFLFVGGFLVADVATPNPSRITLFWALSILLIALGRAAARAYCRRHLAYQQNTVIVGAGEVGQLVARKLLQHPEYGINLVGFVDAEPRERRDDLGHLTVLGSPERLPGIVRLLDVERVILAFSNDSHQDSLELVRSLKDLDIQIDIVPRLFEMVGTGVGIHTVEGLPLIGLPPLRLSRSSLLLKRTLDILGSVVALLALIPLFVVIAVMIKRDSSGPVFFRQVRMGRGDRTFKIFKFRTMVADAEERKSALAHLNKHAANGGDPRMFKIIGDPRMTRVGRFLRRLSLDELPQLLNVLRGDMSLVGPRPLILIEDQYVEQWGRQRLNLKPGMTGPWQVLGGSEIPFEEMVRMDYHYVTGWSLLNDVKLILRTFPAVFRSRPAC
jgi:exopolysaccharide biosynthesis polyprenyl glycosylphosphotransferase